MTTITNEEFQKLYEKLTPENKVKVINKYYELLAEQKAQEAFEAYCADNT